MAVPAIDRARALAAPQLAAILVAGAALNGFAARILESWRLQHGSELLFGISPFELIVLAIACDRIWRSRPRDLPPIGWSEALLAAAMLVPSSTVAWLALAAYAGFTAWRGAGGVRHGALLVLGLAGAALWSAVAINWVAGIVTTLEAGLVAALLAPLRGDIAINANLVGVPGGHEIVLIVACTTANALPRVLLAIAAISLFLGGCSRLIAPMMAISVLFALANWIRLAAMAWSADSYALVHGPIGANLYDLAQSLMVLGAGYWLGRR